MALVKIRSHFTTFLLSFYCDGIASLHVIKCPVQAGTTGHRCRTAGSLTSRRPDTWFIHSDDFLFHPKSEVASFQVPRPTTPSTATSAGSPTTTCPTTPGSCLLYLKAALCPWELRVRPGQRLCTSLVRHRQTTDVIPSWQVNPSSLTPACWPTGSLREERFDQILKEPI